MGETPTSFPRGWYHDPSHGLDFFWGGSGWASHKGRFVSEPHKAGDPDFRPGPVPKKFGDGKPILDGQPLPPPVPGSMGSGERHSASIPGPGSVVEGVEISDSGTKYVLRRLSDKEERTLAEHAPAGEVPWLVINPGAGAGFLAAFEKELIIAKTSLAAGLMAGSLGGRRVTSFPFKQITGIEYNAGMLSGVLEILTASYQGTANKDYWKGTGRGRNADSNDPFTLSNTLPLPKAEYKKAAASIQELKTRVHDAHEIRVSVEAPAAAPSSGIAEQIKQLAELKDQGLLTDEEFVAAKSRLLAQ